jgi:L-ascorbate metabolism protein UlaG (beta-lactamase superfamily)
MFDKQIRAGIKAAYVFSATEYYKMKKRTKRIMITTLSVIILIGLSVYIFMKQPRFGKIPEGERLEKIKKSANFRDGIFQNLNPTPQLAEDASFRKMSRDFFFSKNRKPPGIIPSVKTGLMDLAADENVLVWFGHSSYFIQTDGKKILVDPVFSGHASPFFYSVKAFLGTDVYSPEDFPEIDYLVITHDHWDHLDYKTVLKLKPKIKKIITGLGTGQHLEYWGFDKNRIVEKDWYQSAEFEDGIRFTATPARHFSGRGFRHKKTLWSSFVLETPSMKIFIGGDGGYDNHFAEIGAKFGGFDLAILENGQYNPSWKYIHMMPEQTLQAAKDLRAQRLFPVHNSKFALANHTWDEPLRRITELNQKYNLLLITPMIGEKVNLNDTSQKFSHWWETVN